MREAYQEKADSQLQEWRQWIRKYEDDPAFSGTNQSPERQRSIDRLEDCYRIARLRLDELRSAQEDYWDFTKQAVERAMIDLKKALDESGAGRTGKLPQARTGEPHGRMPFHSWR
jgi:hypothetical protein